MSPMSNRVSGIQLKTRLTVYLHSRKAFSSHDGEGKQSFLPHSENKVCRPRMQWRRLKVMNNWVTMLACGAVLTLTSGCAVLTKSQVSEIKAFATSAKSYGTL